MGSAVIFSGTKVKTLKSAIDLNGGNDIISSTTDPTSSAVSANIGSLLLNSSNGKLYRKNDSGSSTNWTEVGASGQAGINYISNPNAVLNTTGWSTYADAAGAAPVDGTGGSPNVTWTRSTTTPLRGAADFVFAKDSADRQGQGVSVDFTIDNADIAKPLTVTFDYEILSGTYATGDLTVYLIADPAGTPVVIQPAGYQIQSATASTKMRNIATFQTQASGVTYRLCFHVASTSASAYDLAIDNVVVGPQVVQYGAPVTDWVSWTPTGAWTSNVTWTGRYRRVGDSAEFMARASLTGTTTAADFSVNLPSWAVIDTNKLAGTNLFNMGMGDCVQGGNHFVLSVVYNNTTSVKAIVTPLVNTSTHNGIYVTNTVPGTFNSGEYVDIWWRVPITGWSSTVQMSNDTDTRVVAAIVTGDPASASSGNPIIVPTVSSDTHAAYNATTGRYTCPVPGYYKMFGALQSASSATTLTIYKNAVSTQLAGNLDSNGEATYAGMVFCNAGDIIDIRPGGTVDATSMSLNIQRLSGPSAIAASETVVMAASKSSTSLTSFSATTIVYSQTDIDSHSGYSTTTGLYTVPVAGKYRVSGGYYSATSFSTPSIGRAWEIEICKNGTKVAATGNVVQTTSTLADRLSCVITHVISCVAGDTISLKGNQNVNGTTAMVLDNTSENNFFAVELIK